MKKIICYAYSLLMKGGVTDYYYDSDTPTESESEEDLDIDPWDFPGSVGTMDS